MEEELKKTRTILNLNNRNNLVMNRKILNRHLKTLYRYQKALCRYLKSLEKVENHLIELEKMEKRKRQAMNMKLFQVSSSQYAKSLENISNDEINWFRENPKSNTPLVVESPTFYQFFRELEKAPNFETSNMDVFLSKYLTERNELEKRTLFVNFWEECTGASLQIDQSDSKSSPPELIDACYSNLRVIFEFKAELKGINTFPLVQLISYLARATFENLETHSLLVLIAGPTCLEFCGKKEI